MLRYVTQHGMKIGNSRSYGLFKGRWRSVCRPCGFWAHGHQHCHPGGVSSFAEKIFWGLMIYSDRCWSKHWLVTVWPGVSGRRLKPWTKGSSQSPTILFKFFCPQFDFFIPIFLSNPNFLSAGKPCSASWRTIVMSQCTRSWSLLSARWELL